MDIIHTAILCVPLTKESRINVALSLLLYTYFSLLSVYELSQVKLNATEP